MKPLRELSSKQLNKIVEQTGHELKRRENIAKAHEAVSLVLIKYQLSVNDLDISLISKRTATKKPRSKNALRNKTRPSKAIAQKPDRNDSRSVVVAKYQDPVAGNKWSGRGRCPRWVLRLCEENSITIQEFKADLRFMI